MSAEAICPRSEKNWNSQAVFVDGAYQADETWTNAAGDTFSPALHYYVGGNSKVYGAALFRLRERDFGEVLHAGGISPAWPLGYDVFEPYYTQAERLFHVHGQRGEDPLEPWASAPYPHSPVSHEPKIAELADNLRGIGLHPFHLPLGILLDEKDGIPTPTSTCMRCSFFDGFPCLLNGKADAQVVCIDPMLAEHPNVTLLTDAYVSKLSTDASGRMVDAVHVTRAGQEEHLLRRHRGRCVRRLVLGPAALALSERGSSKWPGQRLGSARAQLHAAQYERPHGDHA